MPRSLTRMTRRVLTAIAAIAGWFILDQRLRPTDYLAVALVVIASAGAVRSAPTLGSEPTVG